MASKKFLNPINLLNLASDPSSATEGDVYFNTTDDVIKVYANGSWVPVSAGNPDYITFDTTPETSSSDQGTLSWNTLDGTLDLKLSSDVTLQLGQEQHVRVHNATGSTIPNGTVVYVNGASDEHGHISVAPYIADGSVNVFNVMGLTTAAIPDDADGYVTLSGLVRGLNTSSYTAGQSVFASDTVPGGLTTTQPISPSETVSLGVVTVSHATQGIIFVQIDTGATADLVTYDHDTSLLEATNVAAALNELAYKKADINALSSSLVIYPTSVESNISGYYRMVQSIDDTDYNDTAVNISTGNLNGTGSAHLISSLVADANIFVGTPGSINITTIGNIRKTSGNANAYSEFFFRLYKRTSGGTETLLGSSSTTGAVNPTTLNSYAQFSASGNFLISNFTATDRLVIKYYSNILDDGTQSYEFQFGGTEPVRTLLPVPISVTPASNASGTLVDTSSFSGVLSGSDSTVQAALNTIDDIVEIPDQTGHNGEFLKTTGSALEWATVDLSSKASLSGATFTGEVEATKFKATAAGGDEGGEIFFGKPATNTTIAGTGVTIDVYQNRLRFFEQGGDARGYYIDITGGSAGVGTNLVSSGGSSTLDGLTDVTISGTIADNEVLAYDTATSQWINQTTAEAGLLDTSATAQTKAGDLTITGNLTVNGTTTTINSTAINVNNQVIFEGATANGFETTLTSIDPTADNTISLPNASGTIALAGTTLSHYGITDAINTSETNQTKSGGLTINGTVSLPALTTIGTVTSLQLSYLDTLTEPIQYRLTSLTNSVETINTDLGSKADLVDGVLSSSQIPGSVATQTYVIEGFQSLSQKNNINGYAGLDSNGKVLAQYLDLSTVAPLVSPTFTGTVVLPSTTSIGTITSTEISYLTGITSSVQDQIDSKLGESTAQSTYLTISAASENYQLLDSDLTAIAGLTGTEGFLKKAGAGNWILDNSTYLTTTSAASTYLTIDNAINSYATLAAPTFTGIVVLPSTTSIGTVSATEIGYLDGVTSAIQTQLNGKEASHSHPYQTANASLSSIAALAGTAGFIKFDGSSTYTVDSNTYLVRNQPTIDTAIIAGTSTFSIANSIATTLNIGGAATAITIGSTNANAETIIRTPKISTNATSVQLLNTTATTVEFAGAATELHVGGTSTASSTFNIGANATASSNQKIVNLATSGASGSSTVVNVGTVNDGTINLYGDVVAHGTIEVPTPTINAQAANKGYVDALAAGINIKQQAKYATTSALGVTYTAGSSDTSGGLGEGAFITATANGAFSPDGTEVVAGERVLVKNQTDAKQNGIYVVTDPGDGDSPFILTRASDFNGESATNGNIKNGDYVFITAGSVNSNASFVVSQGGTSTTPSGAIKLGTDNVVFSQYSGVPGNITSLGVVTQGVWQSTRIQKEYLDDELATLNNPTFTGTVTVPAPVVNTDAATKAYVDNSIAANAAALPDIIPLDDIRGQFNGIDSRFQPTFQGETLSILNPLRLLLTVNGIIQTVDFPEYVWQSFLPKEGFMVDSDGYIAFSEVPPAGSTFDARLMPGPNINSVKKGYPFRPVDILLGV